MNEAVLMYLKNTMLYGNILNCSGLFLNIEWSPGNP